MSDPSFVPIGTNWLDDTPLPAVIGSFVQKVPEGVVSRFFRRLIGGSVLKTVWALSGGGAKGCFQIGALIYLSKRLPRYQPESVVATSVGSVNSLACFEGDEGIDKARRVWLSLATKSDMYRPEDWVQEIGRLETFRDNRIDPAAFLMGGSSPFGSGGIELLSHGRETLLEVGSMILPGTGFFVVDQIRQVERDLNRAVSIASEGKSLYSLDPVIMKLRDNVNFDAIREGRTKLRLVSIALEDGSRCYMDEAGNLIQHVREPEGRTRTNYHVLSGPYEDRIIKGAIASAAIPGIFPAQVFDLSPPTGQIHCVDGGVRDILPSPAARELALEIDGTPLESVLGLRIRRAIIYISAPALVPYAKRSILGDLGDPIPPAPPAEPDFEEANFLKVMSAGLNLLTDEILAGEIEPDGGFSDDIDRVFIVPMFDVTDTLTIDPGLIQIAIAYGYMTAFDVLTRYEGTVADAEYRDLVARSLYIAQARRYIWELERNWGARGVDPLPRFWEGGSMRIRALKRRVWEQTVQRIARWGRESVPSDADLSYAEGRTRNVNRVSDWWREWERHTTGEGPWSRMLSSTDPFLRVGSPWEATHDWFDNPIPAEEPPPEIA